MAGTAPTEAFLNRSLYFHYPHYRTTMPHSAMVKGQYKIVYFYETPVRFPDWDPIMLFDLNNDVGEYHNIYADNRDLGDSLYADMTNYFALVGARIPMANPYYDPALYTNNANYAYQVANGPFIGTRYTQEDELGSISFLDYWMDNWGVDIGSITNDFDGDGIVNWVEYARGSDPTDPASAGSDPVLDRAGDQLAYRYSMRNDDSGLTYTVETTTNLVSGVWTNAGTGVSGIYVTGGSLNEVTNTVDTVADEKFIRLKIEN
jgi:hypothetical protein